MLVQTAVRIKELSAGISGEHVDNDHLTPLLHLHQQHTQLAVVAMDQVYALRAYLQVTIMHIS